MHKENKENVLACNKHSHVTLLCSLTKGLLGLFPLSIEATNQSTPESDVSVGDGDKILSSDSEV